MRILFLSFILLFTCTAAIYGQEETRAQKFLLKAQGYKAKKDTARAYKFAQLAIIENPSYDDAYSVLGQWYYDARNFILSARVFANAAKLCTNGNARFALPAARSYLYAQMPDSATYWLGLSSNKNAEASQIATKASFLQKMRLPRDTNQVRKLSIRTNTNQSEFFPYLSADGQSLYYTRRINGVNEDFFIAHLDSCGDWFTGENMGYPPNSAAQESALTITADDHYLFFMRSDNRSENGWARGGYDLYLSYRKGVDSPWSSAESFGATINTPAFEGMPSLSPDINDLYFVSNRPGGYGGFDIWVSHFSFGLWQMPINLGPQINTPGNETAPFISSDNSTLYFASDGHLGMGGADLFVSRKISDTVWEEPVNLGVPINSSADDHSVFVSSSGNKAYFASDRGNTNGNLDIYETTLPKSVSPISTAFAMCYVYDSLTKDPALLGSITLYDTLGNELAQYHANKGDGSILMSMPLNKTFNYAVKGFGYTSLEGSINFPEACPKWCELGFALLPRDYVKPTKDSLIVTINFPKNVTTLNDTQIVALESALHDWKEKPELSIFVNSYTDNTGTPMINTQKSTIRANAVADVVRKLGFAAEQITTTGFGDSSPLVPNDSPENQDKNRRAEVVLRW